jgi:type IV pilus assembly protein PilB
MIQRQSTEAIEKSGLPATSADPATTRARLRAALADTRAPRRQSIGALLTAAGLVHDTGVRRALAAQVDRPEARLGSMLVATGEVSEDELYRALAEQLGVAYVRLGEFDVEAPALAHIPADFARERHLLPLMMHGAKLVIATDDPADNDKVAAVRFRTQMSIETVLASPSDLETAIATHYPLIERALLDSEVDRVLQENIAPATTPIERLAQQKPIVRLVDNLLLNAVLRRASDIHLHPASTAPMCDTESTALS